MNISVPCDTCKKKLDINFCGKNWAMCLGVDARIPGHCGEDNQWVNLCFECADKNLYIIRLM